MPQEQKFDMFEHYHKTEMKNARIPRPTVRKTVKVKDCEDCERPPFGCTCN